MEKLKFNLNGAKELNREQQRSINGGGDVWCSCNSETGSANGPETSCESCFSYCESHYENELVSSLCVG